jgi:DNA replication protein DnaC
VITTTAPPLPDDLEALLRTLRLPHMRRVAAEVLATAKAQRWEPGEVLRALLTEERRGRDRSAVASRRAAAGFPTGKTFTSWRDAVSSIPEPTQAALRTLEWVHRRENLVVCGPSGTGKTFFLEALGAAVVEAGMRVSWFSLESLGALVRRHRVDDTVTKVVGRIVRSDLIVVDDVGLLPVSTDAAEGLYRLVDAAYERRSVAVSSNLHPAGFDELMPKTLATATVDRLLHHAHLCVTVGDSVRLAEATAGDGVVPLTASQASPRPGRRRNGLRRDVPAPVSPQEVTPIEHD